MKKKLPIGIANFETMIRDGYVYVDKTRWIYKMVS
ncbi:MAG: AAA family ATPase, partial [Calditrichaeota bacterium]